LFDMGHTLGLARQQLAALGVLLAFLTALLLLEGPIFVGVLRMGRHLEARLRMAFLEKIPRLGDRYFQSRPTSDMVERSHSVQRLRLLPTVGLGFLRTTFGLVLTTVGIIWIDPSTAPLALVTAGFSVAWPLLTKPVLTERDLRVQTHAGALGRFYLDALLGLVAVRTHGAEQAIRREHEGLLVEWARAGLRLQKTLVGIEGIHQLAGLGLAAWLLFAHLSQGNVGTVLLLVYWALHLPVLGQNLALYVQQYPSLRNTTLRLLEPLGAPETPAVSIAAQTKPSESMGDSHSPCGVTLDLKGVRVVAGGHTILNAIDLHVAAGQHVAIVGPSGAGKSSLVGLLLGWHRAATGQVLVDGDVLDDTRLDLLRQQSAWVDPAVQLWNTSLLENLHYATEGYAAPLGETLKHAHLHEVLHKMPEGLQTPLGESGRRVSGGEGQRVRFGRALMQTGTRLVILDEPFRGLDRAQRRMLLDRARHRWQDATLLCITHDVADTKDFERILVVKDGRLVEDGAPEDLLHQPSRYRELIDQAALVRDTLWSGKHWRRLHLADGVLTEQPMPLQNPEAVHERKHSLTNGYAFPSYLAGRTAS
ncbi:MAG TPA: ABC transporter ATP-binding protein, partial [Rhodothermales bacterium]|nr:ABC transporter ATP-binding protein [Rhodothermales bacterium]